MNRPLYWYTWHVPSWEREVGQLKAAGGLFFLQVTTFPPPPLLSRPVAHFIVFTIAVAQHWRSLIHHSRKGSYQLDQLPLALLHFLSLPSGSNSSLWLLLLLLQQSPAVQENSCALQPVQLRERSSHDTNSAALTIFLRKTQLSALQGTCGGCWLWLFLCVSKLLNESLLFGTEAK